MAEKIFYPDFFNDVFGPIMQPGSSGGFAGTDRIGRVARHALKSEPMRARILFNPSEKRLVSLGTWMEDRAYLGGIMDFDTEDERLFQAHELARGQGLSYEFGELERDNGIPHSTTKYLGGHNDILAGIIVSKTEELGGVESLITYPLSATQGPIPEEQRKAVGMTDALLRLSVGLEDVEDLKEDLKQALTV
jgi:L-serine dehydratase